MGDILCEPCLEEEPMVASNRCHVCEDEECLDRQKYGLNCQALVKACERQARKDGPDQQEAFKTIKRTGGATLKLCCLQFKAKCEAFAISNAGAGKYCTFDWVGFAQEHCVETSTSTETVLQWMTHGEYTHFIKVRDTLTDFQAEQRWHQELATLPAGRKNADGTEILVRKERLVRFTNKKAQIDRITARTKDKKNPKPEDFVEMMGFMADSGGSHRGFSDQASLAALHLGDGVGEMVGGGAFAKVQGPNTGARGFVTPEDLQRREQEREQRRQDAQAKRDNKPFEVSAALSTLKPLLQKALADSAKKTGELVSSWNALESLIDKNEDMKNSMPDALQTMKLRMRLLLAMSGNSKTLEEHQKVLNTFKESSDVKTAQASFGEPYGEMAKVMCWKELEHRCSTFQLTGWQQSRDQKKELLGLIKDHNAVIAHVHKHFLRCRNLKNLYEKNIEKEAAKLQKEAEKAQQLSAVRSNAQSTVDAAAAVSQAARAKVKFQVFDTVHADPSLVTAGKVIGAVDEAPTDEPCIWKGAGKLQAEQNTLIQTSAAKFEKSAVKQNGRGSENLSDKEQRVLPPCPMRHCADKLYNQLSGFDRQYLCQPWIFHSLPDMEHVGPEFLGLGSVKWVATGSRKVIAAEFDGLFKFCESISPAGASISLTKACDILAGADKKVLAAMTKVCKVRYMEQSAGQVVKIPWGWVAAEVVTNNERCSGLRWVAAEETITESFQQIAMALTPSSSADIRANSTAAFLSKILIAFDTVQSGPALKLEKTKMEALQACAVPLGQLKRKVEKASPGLDLKRVKTQPS